MKYWLQISSGRGPAECCWVVAQLTKYIIEITSGMQLSPRLLEATPGPKSGTYRSAIIALEGEENLKTFIRKWEGTIQWIGQSTFRPNHKRKNWFVGIKVLEPVDEDQFQTKDIQIETMRSSGPGGQHANKTESAVRVTHLATGLSAVSQEERSQHLNKKLALARLQVLLASENKKSVDAFDQSCWQQHNSIERGNCVNIFEGRRFRLRQQDNTLTF